MLIDGKRALAYIVVIDDEQEIAGADNIKLAMVGGWRVIVKKDELYKGNKAVFFEIDSKLPETDERFKFLESKHYKIKTMKLGKFGVYSQGLLMPMSMFPELRECDVGADVTEKLGVTYSVAEDNERKKNYDQNAKYKSMGTRHPKLFKSKPIRWMMKRRWGRKLLFFFFGRKKDKPLSFPDFISKTDEERVENQPWRCGDGKDYILTEKLDGTSCTYALRRMKKRGKYEYFVCSRNVRLMDENQKTYRNYSVYWDMEFRYHIKEKLTEYLEAHKDCEWVCIQGEGVGASIQNNPLKLEGTDLYVFNFTTSNEGRISSFEGKEIIESWGMKWVPILMLGKTQDSMEALKEFADGRSAINSEVAREGIVYRSLDGKDSFKNVSRKYLLKADKSAA